MEVFNFSYNCVMNFFICFIDTCTLHQSRIFINDHHCFKRSSINKSNTRSDRALIKCNAAHSEEIENRKF